MLSLFWLCVGRGFAYVWSWVCVYCKSYFGNVIEDNVDVCVLVGYSTPQACLEAWRMFVCLLSNSYLLLMWSLFQLSKPLL